MNRRFAMAGIGAMLSLSALGCSTSHGDEEVGASRKSQIIQGDGDYVKYTLTFDESGHTLADIYLLHETIGSFEGGVEYWYVKTSYLEELGEHDIVISHQDGEGEPSPASGLQEFELDNIETWASFSTDPLAEVGYRYSNGNIHLRIDADREEVYGITWYQTMSTGSPANISPNGTFSTASGAVTIASGHTGYYVSQEL